MAATPANTAAPSADSLTYEQAIAELEGIIERIEQGEIGLQESLEAYRRGAALLRRCTGILEAAEQQVEELAAGGLDEANVK
jgi:exodeoxyribonuclease VII small subunit